MSKLLQTLPCSSRSFTIPRTTSNCRSSLPASCPKSPVAVRCLHHYNRQICTRRPQLGLLNQRRRFASVSDSPPPRGGVKVGGLFLALSILGIGVTSVGLYNYYTSVKAFPPELRKELRSALRCRTRRDYVSSHRYFEVAWNKALELQDSLGILKVTGIAAKWAEMLEEAEQQPDQGGLSNCRGQAYTILNDAFEWSKKTVESNTTPHPQDAMRVVSLAIKLSELAEDQAELEEQSEEQLTWAVDELLRQTRAKQYADDKVSNNTSGSADDGFLVAELELPSWIAKTDMGASLEALGNLYARRGNVEYAMPLYLQSLSLLLPPQGLRDIEPSISDKCHAATIMNNLSSMIAAAPTAPSKDISQLTQAGAWASKAANVASAALKEGSDSTAAVKSEVDGCKAVLVVALYNMGMLKLLDEKPDEARNFLNEAKEKAKGWKLKEAEIRAHEALKTL